MADVLLVLVCAFAAISCLSLAYWYYQRITSRPANTDVRRRMASEPEPEPRAADELMTAIGAYDDASTSFMSRADLFPDEHRPIVDAPVTELIPHALVLARQQAMARASQRGSSYNPLPIDTAPKTHALEPALELAARALVRWQLRRDSFSLQQLAEGPEAMLDEALSPIAAAGAQACDELLEPTLLRADAELDRRLVAALALLRQDYGRALRTIDPCLADAQLRPRLLELLRWTRDAHGPRELRALAQQHGPNRSTWLTLLIEHRIDPGATLLDELLASDESQQLRWALELAKLHADPERRAAAAQAHAGAGELELRMAAIELGVFDRSDAAWLACRELALDRAHPRAIELITSLGSARELAALMRDLGDINEQPVWLLCRSGRKAAAAVAARCLQDTRGDAWAASGLRYIIGDPPNDDPSAHALLRHWARIMPALEDHHRYLHGELTGGTQSIRACLSVLDDRHHAAFADELLFRSRGKIRWCGRGFARATLAAIKAVGTPNIEFERSLGPD